MKKDELETGQKGGEKAVKIWLMNRNRKVMLLEYDTKSRVIYGTKAVEDIRYAPLSVYEAYYDKSGSITRAANEWFRNRGIPSWRKDLKTLLDTLNISGPEELLDRAYGLSLSDQYWIKDENSSISWEDINFFHHDFSYAGYLSASLNSSHGRYEKFSLHSPNNTTDGMIQKGWIIENGKRVLVKGTYYASREEPINEWLASAVCQRLGFEHCPYEIDVSEGQLVSECINFVSDDEEIISAGDIFQLRRKPNNISDYEHYVRILEDHQVPNARKNIEDMFILDYLIMNEDRHMKNFGVIRNAETLKWARTTPVFDSGESMQCNKLTSQINFASGRGKFFSDTRKKYEKIIRTLGNGIIRIDCRRLQGLSMEYRHIMKKYQPYTDASDQRIIKLADGLETRIGMLSRNIEKRKEKFGQSERAHHRSDYDDFER